MIWYWIFFFLLFDIGGIYDSVMELWVIFIVIKFLGFEGGFEKLNKI